MNKSSTTYGIDCISSSLTILSIANTNRARVCVLDAIYSTRSTHKHTPTHLSHGQTTNSRTFVGKQKLFRQVRHFSIHSHPPDRQSQCKKINLLVCTPPSSFILPLFDWCLHFIDVAVTVAVLIIMVIVAIVVVVIVVIIFVVFL